MHCGVEQSVARQSHTLEVIGSSPIPRNKGRSLSSSLSSLFRVDLCRRSDDLRHFLFKAIFATYGMRPIHFEESNATFGKPLGMTDEECLPISAYVGKDENGKPYINTVWQPSKEDIEAINAGRPIIVNVFGAGLPPMCLFTLDEGGKANF